ncbi:hypothetical protein Hs30E_03160 [Lactococcus hodotermopsidis]|uniref:Protein-tyrosine-phosphatase n=1 Tax=Pseudolactococcus hodotermopsidis TaxID=2709157 RepID=A0A6A0BAT5_9LACT|nr:tyrosine-protein phosphatase [Lactococcus hodotermopsidis]GFH41765.1 hypothetical protein Hs30E_03160 [Lactococcus hodotermopsidis]
MTFKKLDNFRDFGGYETTSGRQVKSRILYRSDALSKLYPAEADSLRDDFGIKTIIDFRSDFERATEPDPEIGGVAYHALAPKAELAEYASESRDLKNAVRKSSVELIQAGKTEKFMTVRQDMLDMMKTFVTDAGNRAIYRQMLEVYLNADNYGIIQHCRGGKDRTGFGVAIILGILGVPKETILADFLLTNIYNADMVTAKMADYRDVTSDSVLLANLYDMLTVKKDNLEVAYDEMLRLYGGFDEFVSEGLKFSLTEQEKLRKNLLV